MAEPKPRLSGDEVLAILETGPARIEAATSGVRAARLLEPLEAGGWSPRDIVGHLRACNRTWGGYIARILDEEHASFRAESPRSTIHRTDFLRVGFAESLGGFARERAALLPRLRDRDALARTGTVRAPGAGAGERSAFYYAHRMAEHEREHVRHIERLMAWRDG